MSFRGLTIGVSLFLFLFCYPAGVQAMLIMPTADATIFDGPVGGGKDGTPDYIDHAGPQALNYGYMESRGVLEFSLSGIPSSFEKASLNLHVVDSLGPFPFQADIYTYAADGSITFADFGSGSLFDSFDYSGEDELTFDVTSAIKALTDDSQAYAGFNFRLPNLVVAEGTPGYVAFYSLEDPPAALLKIDETTGPSVVPEPATAWMLLFGIAGISPRRKKQKR